MSKSYTRWWTLHKEIVRAVRENPKATNAKIAAIVGCSPTTIIRHRLAEAEHKRRDYFERNPLQLKQPRHG
jgi:DNA-binding Lrp family transcriptional regulator